MLYQVDVVGLEILCAGFLSRDEVLIQELKDAVDIHSRNQEAFGLPSRLIAKTLIFRILYGGTEYGFVNDPDFIGTSTSLTYWKDAIEKFYTKYKGIKIWHDKIINDVARNSRLVMPTGRRYDWDLMKYGSFKIPEAQVKNYPVQGLGADCVAILRVSFHRRFINSGIKGKLILTVHDSIIIDSPASEQQKIKELFDDVFRDFNTNFERIFGIPFDLTTRYELLAGNNMMEMEEIA
jgi:DNA polymerase-1